MLDRFQRKITRLRVSVTDHCNLWCVYCRPHKDVYHMPRKEILSFEEIAAVVRCATELGIRSFRLTGGEPLTRRGIEHLVASLSALPGVEDLAMTTNGVLLSSYASVLRQAGLMRINISLDSLKKGRFREITGGGNIEEVLEGIDASIEAGFKETKVNMVVMRGLNDDEIEEFALLTKERPLEVRFIEYMAFGCRMIEEKKFVPTREVVEKIRMLGKLLPLSQEKGLRGPARPYRLKGAKGVLGFISPVSQPFCGDCNRLRLTSDGKLRACLLAGGEVDIKSILRTTPIRLRRKAIKRAFLDASSMKPGVHSGTGDAVMCQIGG